MRNSYLKCPGTDRRAGDVMGCIENCFSFFLFFFCNCRFGEFSIIIRYSSCFSFMFRFVFFFFHGDAHNNKTRHYSMHHRVYRRFCFCFKGVPQTNGRVQSHTFLALKNSFFVCLFFSLYLVVVCCIQSVGVSCLQHLLIHLPVERTCNEIIISFSVSVWWWQ